MVYWMFWGATDAVEGCCRFATPPLGVLPIRYTWLLYLENNLRNPFSSAQFLGSSIAFAWFKGQTEYLSRQICLLKYSIRLALA